MEESIEKLKARIRKAFPISPIPDNFVRSRAYGEDLRLIQEFVGRPWDELVNDTDFLIAHHDFSFFNESGFSYYLPAYLIAALRAEKRMLESFVFSIIFKLNPPEWAPEALAFRNNVVNIFTEDQRLVIDNWLDAMHALTEDDDICSASTEWRRLTRRDTPNA